MDDFYCDEVFSGKTKVEKVLETDKVLAFKHTKPHWPVHIVVVPKKHVESLLEADDDILLAILHVVQTVAQDVVAKHGKCQVLTNLGEYQDSKHLHWHVASGKPNHKK
ncbi:HIT domain-containing protein [Candidatus Saccharibacteria bacterium]|nr:HIT domain-containing protein [Candidatus Saccharibacteria bacterium]